MCPPTCSLPSEFSLASMRIRDYRNPNIQRWLDDPINIDELKLVLKSFKLQSSPGLDQIDYKIISCFPGHYLEFMVGLFNRILQCGVFPDSWKQSIVIFIPKPNNKGVRPISLTSCILKVMEKCLYNRLRWYTESNFIIPDTQFGFRSYKSCVDNLVILTNFIHSAFLKNHYAVSVFLDINSAFDNVIPRILIRDLEEIGVPAHLRKFYENTLLIRFNFFVKDGSFTPPYTSNRGTPQGSITSPLLFNIYLRAIIKHVGPEVRLLQYADDLVIFCSGEDLQVTLSHLQSSLQSISRFLEGRGLELSPSKSQMVIFNRKRNPLPPVALPTLNNQPIPVSQTVRFLGIILDCKLSGRFHFEYLISKGRKIISIISSLASVWWGAHPQSLLTIYISVFRSSNTAVKFSLFPTINVFITSFKDYSF